MRALGRLTRRTSGVVVAVAGLSTLGAACADLSGLSGGSSSDASDGPVSHDAGKTHDATSQDATTLDAPGHDATQHEATLPDGSTSDVRQDDGRVDAGPTDAGVSDGGPSDASGKGGPWDATHFCKNLVVPDGATLVCDDFDEDPDASALGQLILQSGGVLATSSAAWSSAPNALHATADPGPGSGAVVQEYIQPYPVVIGSRYSLQCDIRVESIANTGGNQIGGFAFLTSGQPNAALTIGLVSNADGGLAGLILGENTYGLDGGHAYEVHPAVAGDAGLQGWVRVKLTVSAVDGGFVDDLTVDGVAVESHYPLSDQYFTTPTELGLIGWQYVTGDGQRDMYIDNVAFVNE